MIHARKLTHQLAAACPTCRIFHSKAASLPFAPLPKFRLERTPGFTHTACDFAGPFRYKKDSGEVAKAYLLIMICAVSRAIHVELTTDLSTWEVLGALQKFVNRFPTVKTITSDNGASFVRSAKELATVYKHVADGPIRNWLAKSFIAWHFITPTAAAHGGNHERAVQIIKRPLRKILGSAIPHFLTNAAPRRV